MTDNIYTYLVNDMPISVKEFVVPCDGGYTIYINSKLSYIQQQIAYQHALKHIKNGDYENNYEVQKIELKAHKGE